MPGAISNLIGQRITVEPDKKIGEGREAEVYTIDSSTVLLLFKDETHPDNIGDVGSEQAARERLQTMQTKLPALERLPHVPFVCLPQALAFNQSGTIIGYITEYIGFSYPLAQFTQKSFRQRYKISNTSVMKIFRDLRETVILLHALNVIVGDFHPENILINITSYGSLTSYHPYLIDVHSFQFGDFSCGLYHPEYLDPLLCDSTARDMTMTKPYTQDADWYAFTAMLMECLVFSHPYGGVYVPSDPKRRVPDSLRPLRRITVFHPDVRYDRDALPYAVLSDNLLCYFLEVFEGDKRGIFPVSLLQDSWQVCPTCGTEIARADCPVCFLAE